MFLLLNLYAWGWQLVALIDGPVPVSCKAQGKYQGEKPKLR